MKTLLLFFSVFLSTSGFAQNLVADDITGTWVTRESKARIEIFKSGKTYSGRIAWLKEPLKDGKPKTDIKNPSPSLRHRTIVGLTILNGFEFDGDDEWEDGKIYDPETGKTYSCKISMPDRNTLRVRGYIGVSLLGRTEVWKRG
jgi:uncharacterized protein (DUF2147 family)